MNAEQQITGNDFELAIQPSPEIESREKSIKLEKFFVECNTLMGGETITLNLTDVDYRVSLSRAIEEYRGISTRSIFKRYGFIETVGFAQQYTLHRAVDVVTGMFRQRSLFGSNNTGFDYFSQIAAGMIYPGSQPGGYMGIATYDFAMQYQETLEKLFARDFRYTYDNNSQLLYLMQAPRGRELVIIECSVLKTVKELLDDHWSRLWLQKYTIGTLKVILGNKWGKFPNVPGAQGGTQINWQKFAQDGEKEIEKCREAIWNLEDGSVPAYPMMG